MRFERTMGMRSSAFKRSPLQAELSRQFVIGGSAIQVCSLARFSFISAPATLQVACLDSMVAHFPLATGSNFPDNIQRVLLSTCIDTIGQICFAFFGSRRAS